LSEDDGGGIPRPLTAKQIRSLARTARIYHESLVEAPSDSFWKEWLASRGYDVDWVIENFRLGVVDQALPGHEGYHGWLVVPNLTRTRWGDDRVVGVRFRNPDLTSSTKYLAAAGSKIRLYNCRDLARATTYVIACEGETDLWALSQAGLPVVAVPGASAFGGADSFRLRLFEGFARVIVLQDPDDAGANLVAEMEAIDGLEVKRMPDGIKDPSEFLAKLGEKALRTYVLAEESPEEEE
jgi:hypothetical protein